MCAYTQVHQIQNLVPNLQSSTHIAKQCNMGGKKTRNSHLSTVNEYYMNRTMENIFLLILFVLMFLQ